MPATPGPCDLHVCWPRHLRQGVCFGCVVQPPVASPACLLAHPPADVGAAHIQRGTYLSELPAGSVGTFAWMAPEMMLGQKCELLQPRFETGAAAFASWC